MKDSGIESSHRSRAVEHKQHETPPKFRDRDPSPENVSVFIDGKSVSAGLDSEKSLDEKQRRFVPGYQYFTSNDDVLSTPRISQFSSPESGCREGLSSLH